MSSCNNKKTGYTSYKTLSYVIKCIFLMCAFLFIGLFNANDKVEAATLYSCQSWTNDKHPEVYVNDHENGCYNDDPYVSHSTKVVGENTSLKVPSQRASGINTAGDARAYARTSRMALGMSAEASIRGELYATYVAEGGTLYYYEHDKCHGEKKVVVHYYTLNSDQTFNENFTSSELTGNGNSMTLSVGVYVVNYYSTNHCTYYFLKGWYGTEELNTKTVRVIYVSPDGADYGFRPEVEMELSSSPDNDNDKIYESSYGRKFLSKTPVFNFRLSITSHFPVYAVKISCAAPGVYYEVCDGYTSSSNLYSKSTSDGYSLSSFYFTTGDLNMNYTVPYNNTGSTGGISVTVYYWSEGAIEDATHTSDTLSKAYIGADDYESIFDNIVYDDEFMLRLSGINSNTTTESGTASAITYLKSGQEFMLEWMYGYYINNWDSADTFKYKWCSSASSCSLDWSTTGTLTKSESGPYLKITAPTTAGVHYLWVDGSVSNIYDDHAVASNDMKSRSKSSSDARVFKIIVDTGNPTYQMTTSVGTVSGATVYTKYNDTVRILAYDTISGGRASFYFYLEDGKTDAVTAGYISKTYVTPTYTNKHSDIIQNVGYDVKILSTANSATLKVVMKYIKDGATNSLSDTTLTIIIDNVAPTISTFTVSDGDSTNDSTTPASGYTNSSTINYSISATDAYKYMVYDKYGSTSCVAYDKSTTKPTTDELCYSNEGTHELTLYVYDKSGNSTSKTYSSLIYDMTAPSISAFTLTGNSSALSGYTNTGTISAKVTATDNLSGIVSYSIKGNCTDKTGTMNATTSISNYSISSISLSTSSQGNKILYIQLTDAAGNTSTASTTDTSKAETEGIVYDNVKPVISKFVVRGNSNATCGTTSGYTNTTSITYVNQCGSTSALEASDATAGIRYYKVEDGTSEIYAQSATKPTTDTLANTNTGNHTIKLTVTDKAGNVQTKTYTIYYDSTAPTASKFNVIGNSAATAGYTNIRNVTFEITGSDSLSKIREYVVKDGSTQIAISTYTTVGTAPSAPTSGILATATQGTHTLKLIITDFAGNVFETTTSTTVKPFNIILDTTAPVISSFTYAGNANAMSGYTNQQAISYTLNVTDTYFKSGSVTPHNTSGTACSANAKSVTSKSSSGSINLCDTTNGTHQLIVSAVDHAGNAASASTSYNIIMDTVAPVLDLTTTLSPSLPAKNGTATITYTEKYPRVTMTGQTLRYVLATDATASANMTCTVVTSTTLTQDNCLGSSALANTATDVYSLTITLSPTTSGTYYLRVLDENLAMDRAGNTATSPVSKVNMIVNEETVSTYVFGGYLIDQTAPTVSLSLGNGSYNGSGTSTIHYSKTGASITVTFSDNMYLWNYSSAAYYRYCWATSASATCSWTSITGTRSKTQVSGSVTVPSTIGTHYLILEGDVKDYAGWYPTNSYLYTSRTKTASGTRVFKFVTDNTTGSLTIGHTKVGDTYYAKPGISASVNYTDNTALRGYANTNNHMYAWSKSATSISGWSSAYLETIPTRSATRINGITTPASEGVWYLMLFSQSIDAAGNSISTPATYGSATVQYKYLVFFTYNVTVKVYKFIIDGTNPEFVLESGENTYYKTDFNENNEPNNPITELKVGDEVSLKYIEAHTRDVADNTAIKYYISSKADDLSSAIANNLSGYADKSMIFGEKFKIMDYMSGYYIHFFVKNSSSEYNLLVQDYAGNKLSKDNSSRTYTGYYVVTFYIEPQAKDSKTTYVEPTVEATIPDPKDTDGNIYVIQDRKYIVLTITNNDTTKMTLASIVDTLGLELISGYNGAGQDIASYPYLDLVVKSKNENKYSHVSIIIFYNAPQAIINESNNAPVVVNQGEDIGNLGMSFESIDGTKVSVETLITLDGVKVKNVDTNIPGVYNIIQIAKDASDRTTKIKKEIVVLANEGVKEEIVDEEVIEVVEEVVALPVEVKVDNDKVEEVKVVEVEQNRVEVKLENESKVKGYKKKKEFRKIKKEKETFKLLLRTISIKKIIRHI